MSRRERDSLLRTVAGPKALRCLLGGGLDRWPLGFPARAIEPARHKSCRHECWLAESERGAVAGCCWLLCGCCDRHLGHHSELHQERCRVEVAVQAADPAVAEGEHVTDLERDRSPRRG